MYGAAGEFGVNTETGEKETWRGYKMYYKKSSTQLKIPVWPSMQQIQLDLNKGEKLYIVVGQAGASACKNQKVCIFICFDKFYSSPFFNK